MHCKNCDNSMSKNKMPIQAQLNNLNSVSWIGFVQLSYVNLSNHIIYIYCCKFGRYPAWTLRQCVLVETDLKHSEIIKD